MTAFAILNLFTAVLVDSMQILQQNYSYERTQQSTAKVVTDEMVDVKADLLALTQEIRQLREDMARK